MYQLLPTNILSIYNEQIQSLLSSDFDGELYVGNGALLVVDYSTRHRGEYITKTTIRVYYTNNDMSELNGTHELSAIYVKYTSGVKSDWNPIESLDSLCELYLFDLSSNEYAYYDILNNQLLWEE